jgi:hypothetical protein
MFELWYLLQFHLLMQILVSIRKMNVCARHNVLPPLSSSFSALADHIQVYDIPACQVSPWHHMRGFTHPAWKLFNNSTTTSSQLITVLLGMGEARKIQLTTLKNKHTIIFYSCFDSLVTIGRHGQVHYMIDCFFKWMQITTSQSLT